MGNQREKTEEKQPQRTKASESLFMKMVEAMRNGDLRLLAALAQENQFDLNYSNAESHSTLLHIAAALRDRKAVDWLLEVGIDATALNKSKHSAAQVAADAGDNRLATHLIEHGARLVDENFEDGEPLSMASIAAYNGDVKTLKRAYKNGTDFNAKDKHGLTPLHYAAQQGKLDAVKYLVNHGALVNTFADDHNPMMLAGENNFRDVVRFLGKKGSMFSVKDIQVQASLRTARRGHDGVPLPAGEEALRLSCSAGRIKDVDALIKAGANPNAPGRDGVTSLMLASRMGRRKVVERLRQGGADPRATDEMGRTAGDYADEGKHGRLSRRLDAWMKAPPNIAVEDQTQKRLENQRVLDGKQTIGGLARRSASGASSLS